MHHIWPYNQDRYIRAGQDPISYPNGPVWLEMKLYPKQQSLWMELTSSGLEKIIVIHSLESLLQMPC